MSNNLVQISYYETIVRGVTFHKILNKFLFFPSDSHYKILTGNNVEGIYLGAKFNYALTLFFASQYLSLF